MYIGVTLRYTVLLWSMSAGKREHEQPVTRIEFQVEQISAMDTSRGSVLACCPCAAPAPRPAPAAACCRRAPGNARARSFICKENAV